MGNKRTTLTPSEAQAFYDRFGKKQDTQGFYENPALDDLIAHANFHDAQKVFEFGCGTGKFASRLLEEHLSSSAIYLGCDVSPTMINLATQRLLLKKVLKKDIESFETQRINKYGKQLNVWLTVTKLVDDDGNPVAIATTERDITDRK